MIKQRKIKIEFNKDKHYLGKLCRHNHDYQNTGKSLRYIKGNDCVVCTSKRTKIYRSKNEMKIKKCIELYRKNNKEKIKAQDKQYCLKNEKKIKRYGKQYYQDHKDELDLITKEWAKNNKNKKSKINKKYRDSNLDNVRAHNREYKRNNRHMGRANSMKRRAIILNAFPPYANSKLINRKYRIAHILSQFGKTKYHVDHIIPLQSNFVCGLHHEENLQIITAETNAKKGNKFIPYIGKFTFLHQDKNEFGKGIKIGVKL